MRQRKIGALGGVALVLATMTLAGCASGGGSSSGGSPNVITRAQLIETRQNNLYTAIQTLRPQWLRARGASSLSGSSEVVLFVNEAPYGTVSDLSSISIEAVEDVRFMSASEAGARYGTVAGASGVLLVRTRS
jgi:hypothetical protein